MEMHVHIDFTGEKYTSINDRHTLCLPGKPVPDKQPEISFLYPLLYTPSKSIKML